MDAGVRTRPEQTEAGPSGPASSLLSTAGLVNQAGRCGKCNEAWGNMRHPQDGCDPSSTGAGRDRMRTASTRFCLTDSTRIE